MVRTACNNFFLLVSVNELTQLSTAHLAVCTTSKIALKLHASLHLSNGSPLSLEVHPHPVVVDHREAAVLLLEPEAARSRGRAAAHEARGRGSCGVWCARCRLRCPR